MKKKLIPLAILTLLLASPISAADTVQCAHASQRVTISVDGMVCDFCAQSLEKIFLKHASVECVHIDLDDGRVTIGLHENKNLHDNTIKDNIENSGITVNRIDR